MSIGGAYFRQETRARKTTVQRHAGCQLLILFLPCYRQHATFDLGPSPCVSQCGDDSGQQQATSCTRLIRAPQGFHTRRPRDQRWISPFPSTGTSTPRQLYFALDPAASPNKAGDSCWPQTFAGQMAHRPSFRFGLEPSSASLSHAPVESSGEDMPMIDPSMDGSCSKASHSDTQRFRRPLSVAELCHPDPPAGMLLPPFLLVYSDVF